MTSPSAHTYRARIEALEHTARRMADALAETEAVAVDCFDRGNAGFEVSALFTERLDEEALAALLEKAAGGPVTSLVVEELPDADWVKISQGQRGPVRAGRFLVHGSHDRANVVRNRTTIEIDADQAFGTAHHATTRLCLMVLDDLAKRVRPDLIMDLGKGSGILAIAAALAFDRPVVATDNDAIAVDIARENARKAALARHVLVLGADGLTHPILRRLRPDMIVANILSAPLHALAPAIARTLQPGGTLVLSGLNCDQAHAIIGRYGSLGFILEKKLQLDGWAALLMGLRARSPLPD